MRRNSTCWVISESSPTTATPLPLPRGSTWRMRCCGGISARQRPSRCRISSRSPSVPGATASRNGRGSHHSGCAWIGRRRRSRPRRSRRRGPDTGSPDSRSRRIRFCRPNQRWGTLGSRELSSTVARSIGRLNVTSRAAAPERSGCTATDSKRGGLRASSCCCSNATPASSIRLAASQRSLDPANRPVMVPGGAPAGESA